MSHHAPREFNAVVKLRIDDRSKRLVAVVTSDDLPEAVQLSPKKDSPGEKALTAAYIWTQLRALDPQQVDAGGLWHVEAHARDGFEVEFIMRSRESVCRFTYEVLTGTLHTHQTFDSDHLTALYTYSPVLRDAMKSLISPSPEALFIPAAQLRKGMVIAYGARRVEVLSANVSTMSLSRGQIVLGVSGMSGRRDYTISFDPTEPVEIVAQGPQELAKTIGKSTGQGFAGASGQSFTIRTATAISDTALLIRVLFETEQNARQVFIDAGASCLVHDLNSEQLNDFVLTFPTLLGYAAETGPLAWLPLLTTLYPGDFHRVIGAGGDKVEIHLQTNSSAFGKPSPQGMDRVLQLRLADDDGATLNVSPAMLRAGQAAEVLSRLVPGLVITTMTSAAHPKADLWTEKVAAEIAAEERVLIEVSPDNYQVLKMSQVHLHDGSADALRERAAHPELVWVGQHAHLLVVSPVFENLGKALSAQTKERWDKVMELAKMADQIGLDMKSSKDNT